MCGHAILAAPSRCAGPCTVHALGLVAQRTGPPPALLDVDHHAGGARGSIGACLAALSLPAVSVPLVWRILLLLGLSHLVVQVVKRTVGRPRPSTRLSFEALIHVPDRFSFPSGHACAAMAVAVGFAAAFPMFTLPLLIIACVVGFSRVALGVHYPGDVLVGQAIALITAYPMLA